MRPRNFIDLTGQRFGMLVALRSAGYRPGGSVWICACNCGRETLVYSRNLRLGRTMSCGCTRIAKIAATVARHGNARRGALTSEYRIWRQMIQRCTNPKDRSYKYYGQRGITVCERWLKFENFLADMGHRPSSMHSMDRQDNDGHYEPGNCRWATAKQQRANRRKAT